MDFVWKDEAWTLKPAAGGLVSLLSPLTSQAGVQWFCCVSEPQEAATGDRSLFTTAADQAGGPLPVVPIPLPAALYDDYYGRISNEILWMLQHRLIGPGGFAFLDADRHRAWEHGYLRANAEVAAAIRAKCPAARAFLVQDYHFYPLPAMLRALFPRTPIAHFTHIPFPVPELMKLLPPEWRETILRGLLGADIVGFQTEKDVEAFVGCCRDFLGSSIDYQEPTVLADDGRAVAVRAFPAGVNPEEIAETMQSPRVEAARDRIKGQLGELNIVRVDRVDPSKNQVLGFQAFGRLLELRPELRTRLRFLAFLVPSRTDLLIYRSYRDEVYATIDAINRRFAKDCGGQPITVFYTNDREQALAAMEMCDVLLVNSVQDGMNLVAKEWALVSRRPGVLVVSDTTGVAPEARGSALTVSPLDVEGTAHALSQALELSEAERTERLARFAGRVRQWTATSWLVGQLAGLNIETSSPRSDQLIGGTSTPAISA
jgi:trehalose 6-phosphate synthase